MPVSGSRVEAYLSLHPRIREDNESTFELIYGEFLLREELGDSPSLEGIAIDSSLASRNGSRGNWISTTS